MLVDDKVLKARSVHTFIWPFFFGDEGDKKFDYGNTKKVLSELGWKEQDFNFESGDINRKRQNIALKQYLSKPAQNIFFRNETEVCSVYTLPISIEEYEYVYYIEKREKKYELPIVEIELHVYKQGVGILFIQTINEDWSDIGDIKLINDYGRRISLPFIPAKNIKGEIEDSIVADELGILIKKNENISDENSESSSCVIKSSSEETSCEKKGVVNFKEAIVSFYEKDGKLEKIKKCLEIPDFLKLIINNFGENDLRIIPLSSMEDRMFCNCMIRNEELSKKIKINEFNDNDAYSIVFIDETDSTCQEGVMRSELMNKACYKRWQDWGTMYAFTEYSAMCITTDGSIVNNSVVTPYIGIYTYLISLALAQRVILAKYSDETCILANGIGKKGKISFKKAKELIGMQERYIEFENQMMILEVSNQQQGIEIYNILKDRLLVSEEKKALDDEMNSIYEVANISSTIRLACKANVIAWIAVGIAVIIGLVTILYP